MCLNSVTELKLQQNKVNVLRDFKCRMVFKLCVCIYHFIVALFYHVISCAILSLTWLIVLQLILAKKKSIM